MFNILMKKNIVTKTVIINYSMPSEDIYPLCPRVGAINVA